MSGPANNVTPIRAKRSCPECGRATARESYPFCSERCKNVDLNRWLVGAYVIPGRDDEVDSDKPSSDEADKQDSR